MAFAKINVNLALEKYWQIFQSTVGLDGLRTVLGFLSDDELLTDRRHAAYALATIKHETANTFLPIAEYGRGRGHSYGNPDPETGRTYYGRGYVQLTWRRNYQYFTERLGVDLVTYPELAKDERIAWQILSIGMLEGKFTGKRLTDYIDGENCDYVRARKIVNGLDKAELIAGYARRFERIVTAAKEAETSPVPPTTT